MRVVFVIMSVVFLNLVGSAYADQREPLLNRYCPEVVLKQAYPGATMTVPKPWTVLSCNSKVWRFRSAYSYSTQAFLFLIKSEQKNLNPYDYATKFAAEVKVMKKGRVLEFICDLSATGSWARIRFTYQRRNKSGRASQVTGLAYVSRIGRGQRSLAMFVGFWDPTEKANHEGSFKRLYQSLER